ncbi:ABC-three component system middle component 2 [Bradyrhizobium sp. 151]|uniref:ABC-three component system middle component 2 n=1 Tax=Bradyrhizobium sp. 151 TaxID=2782626 RepID=UPI00205DA539|nr:hypothetical protein [Bradyrhizobium sp. 151]UPK27647.1 hypothetical protein IVB26_03275 [Bradyrhizobium sp. 195]
MNLGDTTSSARLFNTPLECGFRLLFVLDAGKAESDLQRLISYDYLIVHSGDVDGGPPSLHPAVPFRGTEFLVRRDLVRAGLDFMFSRELLDKHHSPSGIVYAGTALTKAFVQLLSSRYAAALRARAEWVASSFGAMNDDDLSRFMSRNIGRWGAEFDRLTSLRGLDL